MSKQLENMDDFFREKMQSFSPNPPEHIWTGIEKGLAKKPIYILFLTNWKSISAAVLLLFFLSLATWYFMPNENIIAEEPSFLHEIPELVISEKNETGISKEEIESEGTEEAIIEVSKSLKSLSNETNEVKTYSEKNISEKNNEPKFSEKTGADKIETTASLQNNQFLISDKSEYLSISGIQSLQSTNINFYNPLDLSILSLQPVILQPEKKMKTSTKGSWELAFFFSPEVIFKDFDSVRMLGVYSFNVEPTYYINKHWFLRFGAGISSMRDRGFANLDYISNELMGTYDDVYDITFDSVNGKLVPTYYTAPTEVWDSVRRLTITEATNQYLYLQTPVLFGYYKKSSHFNWYFYGGPAVNFLVYEKTQMSIENAENITIIDLENRLPGRSPYFFQLWLGGGIEYDASKHLSLAIEPNYRYYFSGVYNSQPYKTGFSGFALRLGIIYKIF